MRLLREINGCYPLLYSLEGKGLLSVLKSRSPRSKVYVLTEEGQAGGGKHDKRFISAQKYLLESIGNNHFSLRLKAA